uniref:Predicted protein n=1 Tax=Hordeum vulgare subsp. vulgare TaxID=112509 RepID=F2DFE8_HORVV|nr:predicted protein [Hordeum vulgare subsp. vulgare]
MLQEFTEGVAARSQAIARQFKSLKVKAVAALLSLSKNDTEEDDESTKEEERSYGSMMMERLTGSPDGRVDHVLQVIKLLQFFDSLYWCVVLLTLVIKINVLHCAREWYCAIAFA